MFVRNRPWDETRGNWTIRGKVHWMVRPWVTECGLSVSDSWQVVDAKRQFGWRNEVCKHCLHPDTPNS